MILAKKGVIVVTQYRAQRLNLPPLQNKIMRKISLSVQNKDGISIHWWEHLLTFCKTRAKTKLEQNWVVLICLYYCVTCSIHFRVIDWQHSFIAWTGWKGVKYMSQCHLSSNSFKSCLFYGSFSTPLPAFIMITEI